ncbi:hypothetical protein FB451DRAFT_1195268 [Mycena latifolia]|nr:hypothetical protein FB451DRAFT_1195268 [Mycena latifolia]
MTGSDDEKNVGITSYYFFIQCAILRIKDPIAYICQFSIWEPIVDPADRRNTTLPRKIWEFDGTKLKGRLRECYYDLGNKGISHHERTMRSSHYFYLGDAKPAKWLASHSAGLGLGLPPKSKPKPKQAIPRRRKPFGQAKNVTLGSMSLDQFCVGISLYGEPRIERPSLANCPDEPGIKATTGSARSHVNGSPAAGDNNFYNQIHQIQHPVFSPGNPLRRDFCPPKLEEENEKPGKDCQGSIAAEGPSGAARSDAPPTNLAESTAGAMQHLFRLTCGPLAGFRELNIHIMDSLMKFQLYTTRKKSCERDAARPQIINLTGGESRDVARRKVVPGLQAKDVGGEYGDSTIWDQGGIWMAAGTISKIAEEIITILFDSTVGKTVGNMSRITPRWSKSKIFAPMFLGSPGSKPQDFRTGRTERGASTACKYAE